MLLFSTKSAGFADKQVVSIAPLVFTGVSQFSTDFQTILSRAVQIAQIPVTALQNKDSDVLQQKTLLSSLNSAVGSLADTLTSLGTVAASQAVSATSSDPTKVGVTATGATAPVTFTINSITSAATAASERSTNHYADSASTVVSATGNLKLAVGTQNYPFTVANHSLVGIRDKINTLGAGVTASILTTADGNYLSISANATGVAAIQLFDDPTGANTNLLTSTNPGTNAVFQLNGIPIIQTGNIVNSVIPGVTFSILRESDTPVTLTLATDRTKLSAGLQDFVSKYNALRTQVTAQVGPAAGLLSGDPVVSRLQATLREVTSYRTSSGAVRSLADVGVEFSQTGEAAFNPATFNALNDSQISDAFAFLGSATAGFGGLSARLNEFSDPISGIIKLEQSGIDRTDQNLQSQITTLTDRINVMQANLSRQLQMADALAAQLESQQKALTASLQGLSLVLYGRSPNSV